MSHRTGCRRRHDRFPIDGSLQGRIEFGFPRPEDFRCVMPLRDLSGAGLSFQLGHELPGLEAGDPIEQVRVQIGEREFRGDLLVMHFTPDSSPGSVCGALFYPEEDRDLLTLRVVLRDLETGNSTQHAPAADAAATRD